MVCACSNIGAKKGQEKGSVLDIVRKNGQEKGSVLDIVYSPPSFFRRYTRWFR
jgi:uncharacterized radical SAM superfamily Fe-S cluster-containing enzyme